ncbi:MAG TPA: metalloregulator ArsR/SmtB family transcription factor [Pyrinomonadaceae bacterium]|nr:metalloregulator ArsR/SmtB family transcription factor [Pyrinomonadaceae bacterium]
METFFMALADKTRLRLLNLMREDEICVCFFSEVLEESQPKVSRHLAYLRNAGIVEARRDGKWMHYRIIKPENAFAAQVLEDTLRWLDAQDEMQKDYQKLAVACCAPTAPVTIMRAPKPNTFIETDISFDRKEELETFLL